MNEDEARFWSNWINELLEGCGSPRRAGEEARGLVPFLITAPFSWVSVICGVIQLGRSTAVAATP